jgi:hypothetical protein
MYCESQLPHAPGIVGAGRASRDFQAGFPIARLARRVLPVARLNPLSIAPVPDEAAVSAAFPQTDHG